MEDFPEIESCVEVHIFHMILVVNSLFCNSYLLNFCYSVQLER